MSVKATNNVNVLPIYKDRKYWNHRRSFAYNRVFPFVSELGFVPPFQILENDGILEISSFKIISYPDGVEVEVVSELGLQGWNIQGFDDYVLGIFPGKVAFTGVWNVGKYYLEITDGVNIWYSEIFTMSDGVSGCLRLEWWHNRNFDYPGGHIEYNYPFKYFLYLNTDIGKPEYNKIEEFSVRAGRDFPLRQTSWKEWKFEIIAPEYMCDALHRVGQHDNIGILINDVEYEIEKFDIEVDWQRYGDVAVVVCTFRTNTFVTIVGRSAMEMVYEAESCGCLVGGSIQAKSVLVEGSDDYNNFRYLDSNGNPVDLEDGDEVLIQDLSGELNLYNFNGSGYELYYDSEDDFADVCTGNDQEYYFWNVDQYQQTEILNVNDLGGGDYLISGVTFDDVFIDIYLSDGLGNFLFETSGTWEEFEGAGIPFNSGGSDVVQVRPRTVNCEDFGGYDSQPLGVGGIGVMIIDDTFIVS
jgi:uncharacterized protein YqkB